MHIPDKLLFPPQDIHTRYTHLYHIFFQIYKLYTNNVLGSTIDSYVKCDTFDGVAYKGAPYLNVTCVYNPDKQEVLINVINVNKDKALTADIEAVSGTFDRKAEVRTVVQAMDAVFSAANAKDYEPVITSENVKDGKLSHTFPAASFTQIVIPVK